MGTLLLARHGETDWNLNHKWQGHTGPPLNETGRRQAADLANRVADIDAIYSSDTERARETAEIVAASLGLPVATDPRLREVNFGEWEGLTRAEIDLRFSGAFTRWEAGERPLPAGVEADEAMAERVLDALREIAEAHPSDRVLVVTSGGPIRSAQAHLLGIDQPLARKLIDTVDNCALVELVTQSGAFDGDGR